MSDVTNAPPGQGIERRLATILCADVAGYSRLMGENEERTVRVFRGHREIFESLVAQHRGRIFNTAGDALLAEFASAVEAVRCATDIQSALRTRNDHLAPEERMQFRIGINLGDVIIQGGDLLGDGVNVAARIQAATEPGGICISGSVHEQIQNKLSLEFKLLGDLAYKNIAKPIRTYTIAEGAAVTAPPRTRPSRTLGVAFAVVALAGAGGYWAYSRVEAEKSQRVRVEAELAAQKKAADEAQRSAEQAKREAQLQAQRQAAEDALRRAQEERVRAEAGMKRLQDEKRAVAAAPAATPPAATTAARYDGLYSGQLCNRVGGKNQCWPVALSVTNGSAEASWLSRTSNASTAKGTVSDGTVRLTLEGWSREGAPMRALMFGRAADDAISASGKWSDGGVITGEWKRGTFAAASAPAKGLERFDGKYVGEVCNQFRDRPPHCFKLPLTASNGKLAARWKTPKGEDSSASGKIAADGKVELTLHSFTPGGEATQATLTGRIGNGVIDAAGKWRGGLALKGSWKRG